MLGEGGQRHGTVWHARRSVRYLSTHVHVPPHFQAHPQYAKLPFFAFGESYAGHYIPAVTHAIWQHNLALPPHAVHINLVGTSVGNGLTNPSIQYAHYAEMAISTNHHKPAVSNLTHGLMVAATAPCIAAIEACKASRAACLVATDACNLGLLIPYTLTGMNPYDMRIKCAKPPFPEPEPEPEPRPEPEPVPQP